MGYVEAFSALEQGDRATAVGTTHVDPQPRDAAQGLARRLRRRQLTQSYTLARAAYDHMGMTGDVLAASIVKKFPRQALVRTGGTREALVAELRRGQGVEHLFDVRVGPTLRSTFAIVPSAPITNVDRSTPQYVLPLYVFSAQDAVLLGYLVVRVGEQGGEGAGRTSP